MKSDKLPPVMSLSGYLHCGLYQKNVDVYAALQVSNDVPLNPLFTLPSRCCGGLGLGAACR